nr:hypothetical protein [Rhodoferax sp.]
MPRAALAIVLFLRCLSASAEEALPKDLPPSQEAAAVQSAERIGLAIYLHDRAAAVATDAAFKLHAFKEDQRIRGWITEEKQGQIVVTFIDQTPSALYRIAVSRDGTAGPVMALESATALTDYELGAASARAVASAAKFERCSDRYNSVVLPAADTLANNWIVYLLPGTTKSNVVPIGGTYRIDVSGNKISGQRGFTRTCITLQTAPDAVGLFITHLLDPVPTEAHVFWSLRAKKPLLVATPPYGTLWAVEGNSIRLTERKTKG